jgi:hypothetical protein
VTRGGAGHLRRGRKSRLSNLAVHQQYGDRARHHVAERIGACTMGGDMAGVQRWTEIAARLDQLMSPGEVQ